MLPFEGNLPQCGGSQTLGVVPKLDSEWFRHDPLDRLICHYFTGSCKLPHRGILRVEEISWVEGVRFHGNINSFRSYACKVGWMSKEPIQDLVVGFPAIQRLKAEFNNVDILEPQVFEFCVECNLDDWLIVPEGRVSR